MPTGPARTTDDVADNIRQLIDRVVEARFTKEMAARAAEAAETLAARSAEAGERATEAWRDSEGARKQAAKRVARAQRDATRWSERAWRRSVRPALKDLIKDLRTRRTLAIGAAGAAIPVGREVVDQAAVRLGMKRREERHWGSFFLGLVLGIAAGIAAALLMAPKSGREIRRDLSAKATEVADEIATRAREEWVPLFERDERVTTVEEEGPALEVERPATATIEGATEGATQAAQEPTTESPEPSQTAEQAINEAFESKPSEPLEREQA